MKKITFTYLSFLLLLFNLQLFSQNHTMSKSPQIRKSIQLARYVIPPSNTWHYIWGESDPLDYKLSMWTTGNEVYQHYVRTGFKFDLSDIPSYALNITANIEAYLSAGLGESKIVLISDDTNFDYVGGNSSENGVFTEVESGSVLFTTPASPGVLNNVTSHVVNRISQGYINFGVRASAWDNYGDIIIKLHIDYELPITAKNNFSGGLININVNNPATSKTTPSTFNVIPNISTVTLTAVEQIKDDYERIWHTGSIERSNWDRNAFHRSFNQTFPFTATESDAEKTYTANLRKNYKITRNDDCSEFDNIQTSTSYIVEQHSDTITAPPTKPVNGRNYKFVGWEDDLSKPNPRPLSPTDNEEYTALYKYPKHSNNINGYNNSSQKKMVRSPNGHLHMVYESMDRVWYEKSTDNGNTWTLMNDGKPLSNDVSRYPSIDFYANDKIMVAYNNIYQFQIVVKVFNLNNPTSSYESVVSSFADVTDMSKPTIANSTSGGIIIIWDNNVIPGGLKYRHGYLYSNYIYWYNSPTIVPNTSHLSTNASLAGCKNYAHPLSYWLAWAENNQTIKVIKLDVNPSTHVVTFSQFHYYSNAGYTYNREPSISVISDNNYRIAWIGEKTGEKKVVTYFNNQYWKFGWYPTSASISATDDGRNIIAYSDNYGSTNKFAHIWWYQQYKNLNIPGKQVQLSNGSSMSNMYAESFQNTSSPYSFSTSSNLGSLAKIGNNKIYSGREAIVSKDSVQFYYLLGDVLVDDNSIEPIDTDKNPDLSKVEKVNGYLRTEVFNLTDNSEFTFSVNYGVTDSLASLNVLSEKEYVAFRVELVENSSNRVLGEYHKVVFSSSETIGNGSESFKIDTKGIGNKEVYLRLVVEENVKGEIAIANVHSEDGILGKKGNKQFVELSYTDEKIITDYSLSQNYPNPFNPVTTISYQIPTDGFVTLKVYDVLGKEVASLVNEQKSSGRYNVQFDGSSLSSGIYFYKISSEGYVETKKLMLMK